MLTINLSNYKSKIASVHRKINVLGERCHHLFYCLMNVNDDDDDGDDDDDDDDGDDDDDDDDDDGDDFLTFRIVSHVGNLLE